MLLLHGSLNVIPGQKYTYFINGGNSKKKKKKKKRREKMSRDFSGGTVVKNLPANSGDMGLSPSLGRSHMPWSN